VTSASASVTWFTDGLGTTILRYGNTPEMNQSVALDGYSETHRTTIMGLEPNTTYYAQAISNGKLSEIQSFKTARHGFGSPHVVYGTAESDGEILSNALVVASVEHGGFVSQPISAISDENGHFLLNLGNLKTTAGYAMNYGENDNIIIRVVAGFNYEVTEQVASVESASSAQNVGSLKVAKATSTSAVPTPLVTSYALHQSYPNPFAASTKIRYQIPTPGHVSLHVYNSVGQLVRTLVDAELDANRYEADWDGKNDRGEPVVSGIYFYRLESGDFGQTNKMVLVK
jgi:hypothetical protein